MPKSHLECTDKIEYPIASIFLIDFLKEKCPDEINASFEGYIYFSPKYMDMKDDFFIIMEDSVKTEDEVAKILGYTSYSIFDFEQYIKAMRFDAIVDISLITRPYKK